MTEIEEVVAEVSDFGAECLKILDKFKVDQNKWLVDFKEDLTKVEATAGDLFSKTLIKSMEYVEKIAKGFELVKEDKRQVAIWLAGQIVENLNGDKNIPEEIAANVYDMLKNTAEPFVDSMIAASKGVYSFARKRVFCCC